MCAVGPSGGPKSQQRFGQRGGGEMASQAVTPALVPECLYVTGFSQHILHVSTVVCESVQAYGSS